MEETQPKSLLETVLVELRAMSEKVGILSALPDQMIEIKDVLRGHLKDCRNDMGCVYEELKQIRGTQDHAAGVESVLKHQATIEPHLSTAEASSKIARYTLLAVGASCLGTLVLFFIEIYRLAYPVAPHVAK